MPSCSPVSGRDALSLRAVLMTRYSCCVIIEGCNPHSPMYVMKAAFVMTVSVINVMSTLASTGSVVPAFSSQWRHTVMAKNIGTPALLSDHFSHKKCCNYKCFGIDMFSYFVCIGKTKKIREKKLNLISFHTELQNGLDKMIGTLKLIFASPPFGKNNWDQSLPVIINEFLTPLYWNFGPTLLLPTAPGVSDLKGAFSQLLFWDLSTGVLWDLDLDSLLATSELSSALS